MQAVEQKTVQRSYYDSYGGSKRVNPKNLDRFVTVRGLSIIAGIPSPKPLRILEVGCGDGILNLFFDRHFEGQVSYCGIDLSLGRLKEATQFAPRGVFAQSDAAAFPFADCSFDLVFTNGLIHHVPDFVPVIHEMVRACRPGGFLRIVEPNRFFPGFTLLSLLKKVERGILKLSSSKLKKHLKGIGCLKDVEIKPVNTYFFPYRSFPPDFIRPGLERLEQLGNMPWVSSNFILAARKKGADANPI